MAAHLEAGALNARLQSIFPVEPAASAERMCENMRSSLARGLPELKRCRLHRTKLSVAGGGPSLSDTCSKLDGYIAAVNGSLRFLLERGIVPNACGVLDPGPHMADVIVADRRVRYYVASICDPSVFDKLRDCHVTLWHPSGQPECEALLKELRPENWFMVGGGSTMGLRWINLGYQLGFRDYDLHGLDSSFRGKSTHAYPDRADSKNRIKINGRETRRNFLAQVADFAAVLERFSQPDVDAIEIEVRGEGLLQDYWRGYRTENPRAFRNDGITFVCVNASDYLGRGREYVEKLYRAIYRNTSLPFDFVCFTDDSTPYDEPICRRPLPHPGLSGWWNKLSLFKPGTFQQGERVVYLDLDTLISGDIDWLARYRGEFAMLSQFFANVRAQWAGPQSGVMAWRGGFGAEIWRAFEERGFPDLPGGDQAFINSVIGKSDLLQSIYPGEIVSYKGGGGEQPKRASVVCFHGLPRPHEVSQGWVPQMWSLSHQPEEEKCKTKFQ